MRPDQESPGLRSAPESTGLVQKYFQTQNCSGQCSKTGFLPASNLVAEKVERLVLLNWAADGGTALNACIRLLHWDCLKSGGPVGHNLHRKRIARLNRSVAQKPEDIAMGLI